MKKHATLKVVHVISLFCFAIIVGCLVSIYSHFKTIHAQLSQKDKELTTNSARARLTSLETKVSDLSDHLAKSEQLNKQLKDELSLREQTIQEQKEELKIAADQIRKMSGKRR